MPIETAVADDYVNRIVRLVNGNDAYWLERAASDELPEIIRKLQQKLTETKQLTELISVANRYGNSRLLYTPSDLAREVGGAIVQLAQDDSGLLKIEKDLKDFNYLEPLLKANLEGIHAARKQHELKTNPKETKEAQINRQKNAIAQQAELYMTRGLIYKDYNQYKYHRQAYDCFSRAIAFNIKTPAVNMALRKRAELYLDHGKEAEALADLKRASNTSANAWTWFEYASALYVAEQHDAAIVAVQQALELDSEHQKSQRLYYSLLSRNLSPDDAKARLEALISSGRKVKELEESAQNRGELPLFLQAATKGDVALADFLLKQNRNNIMLTDSNGNNALHLAARYGHVELIPFLRHISYGSTNNDNQTPLFIAAAYGHVAMVEAMLETGVAATTDNSNVLLQAIEHGQGLVLAKLYTAEIYPILVKESGGTAALLQHAIKHNQEHILKMLLEYHFDAINKTYQECNALQFAILQQNTAAVDLLLHFGADLNDALKLAAEHAPDLTGRLENAQRQVTPWQNNFAANSASVATSIVKNITETVVALQQPDNVTRFSEILLQQLASFPKAVILLRDKTPELTGMIAVVSNYLATQSNLTPDNFAESIAVALALPWHNVVLKTSTTEPVSNVAEVKTASDTSGSEAINLFCERFERKLDSAYGYFNAVARGDAVAAKDKVLSNEIKTGAESVGRGMRNTAAAAAVVSAVGLGLYLRTRYNRDKAARMVNIFKAVTPTERVYFIRYTAERLAAKYANQINHLAAGSEGVELFADCAAARVIEYIVSSEQHHNTFTPNVMSRLVHTVKSWVMGQKIPPQQKQQKALYDIFIDGIVRITSQFPQDSERLRTINNLTLADNWNAKGIFENTGVITSSGARYAHDNTPIDNYGYCFGSKEEAESRGLTLGPSADLLWGPGRQWQLRKNMPSLVDGPRAQMLFAANMPRTESSSQATIAPKPQI